MPANKSTSAKAKQLIMLVIAGFFIPIIVLSLLVEYANNVERRGAGTQAMSESAIAQRVAPLAHVDIGEALAPASEQASQASESRMHDVPSAAAAIAAISSMPSSPPRSAANTEQLGQALYTQVCQMCHAAGLLGAPKFGNKADWAARLKGPMDEIYNYALHGKGNMPPKGGSSASDDEVKAAVDYMLKAVK